MLHTLERHLPEDVALRALVYDADEFVRHEGLLAPEERERRDAFLSAQRRREFTLGRAAARTLLAERLDVPPPAVPLVVAPDEAVDVHGTPWQLSITHKGDRAVAAVGQRVLGIDLEAVRPHCDRLVRRVFRADERHLLETLPLDAAHAAMLGWTLKEAVLKALRTGFRLSPQKLRITVDPASLNAEAGAAEVAVDDGGTWRARFVQWDAFYLAVAFR